MPAIHCPTVAHIARAPSLTLALSLATGCLV
jgi:hypothetical protein